MAKGKYRIRQAGHDDVGEVVTVRAEIFQEAYADLLPEPARTAQATPERLAASEEFWRGLLHRGEYLWILTTAESQRIVGMAHACLARDADPPQSLELAMLNVHAEARGSGAADRLLTTAIGDAPAYLWVLDGNERAQAFYRRHGFVADGTSKPYGHGVDEIRMVRD